MKLLIVLFVIQSLVGSVGEVVSPICVDVLSVVYTVLQVMTFAGIGYVHAQSMQEIYKEKQPFNE